MIKVKTNPMKYKDSNGNMIDVGGVIGKEVTDLTLTKSNVPADSKTVGDKLNKLSEEIVYLTKAELEVLTQEELATKYENGTRIIVVKEDATNLVHQATNTFGKIYNGCGYMNNYRLNSVGEVVTASMSCVTGFMPYTHGNTIVVSGSKLDVLTFAAQYVAVYDENYNVIQSVYGSALVNTYGAAWELNDDGIYEMTIDTNSISDWSSAKYFRASFAHCHGADLVVTSKEV